MGKKSIQYNDKWILILLIIVSTLIFSALGYVRYGSDYQIKLDSVALNFLYATVLVGIIREIVSLMDSYYPWTKGIDKRILFQLLITLIIYLLGQTLILYLIEPTFNQSSLSFSLHTLTYASGTVLTILANIAYLILYIRQRPKPDKKGIPSKHDFINGMYNGNRISLSVDSFILFYIQNAITFGIDDKKRKIILQDNLSEIEEITDKNQFYRANRQFIVARKAIKEIKYNPNKTCSLIINQNEEDVIISRYKAANFKKWWKKNLEYKNASNNESDA